MKALLLKEIRQGKMILLFGLCFGLLLWLLAGVLIYRLPSWQAIVDILLAVGVGGTLLIALLSGAGLFAGEIDRGTLPLMLSLPISRKRIWGSKVIAGLVLGLLASGLLLVVVLPIWYPQLDSWRSNRLSVWPWICCWFAVYCISLFFSTLMEHTVGVILAALLVCIGLGVLAGYTIIRWGGSLLGYDPLSDVGLWLLTLTPAILLASLAAFRRGELLRGPRKWLIALTGFLLIAASSVLLLVGSVRWAVRYIRPLVAATCPAEADWNERNIALFALRSPARELFLPRDNWRIFSPNDESYRSRNLVLLSLADGQEQQVIANGLSAAFSADGKKAAVMHLPQGLTWWESDFAFTLKRRIAVFDLAAKKSIADFALETQWGKDHIYLKQIFLSPGGSWLACETTQEQSPQWGLLVSDVAGNKLSQIELLKPGAWAWGPDEKGIFSLDPTGRLVYSPLPAGDSKILWQGREILPLSDFDRIKQIQMTLSPDGRWLALKLLGRVPNETGGDDTSPYQDKLWIYVIAADGRQVYPLPQEESVGPKEKLACSNLVWSADSGRLCYLSSRITTAGSKITLHQWRRGESPVVSKLPFGGEFGEIVFRSPHDDLLIWSRQGVLLADKLGKLTPPPAAKISALAKDHDLLGLDQTGRAIVLRWPIGDHNHVRAVDLTTGKLAQIYP